MPRDLVNTFDEPTQSETSVKFVDDLYNLLNRLTALESGLRRCETGSFLLPYNARFLNVLAREAPANRRFAELRNMAAQHARRSLPTALGRAAGSATRVWWGLHERTFGWNKFAECVPYEHLTDGIRDANGALSISPVTARPVFEGIGCGRDAVNAGFRILLQRGCISRTKFMVGVKKHYVYTSVPVALIAREVVGAICKRADDLGASTYAYDLGSLFASAAARWDDHIHVVPSPFASLVAPEHRVAALRFVQGG